MGWLTFTAETSEDFKKVELRLVEIRNQLGDVTPLLQEVRNIYVASVMKRFKSHTDPKGRAWKRLKKKTIAAKQNFMGKRSPSIESPYNQLIWSGKLRSKIKVLFQKRERKIQIGVSLADVPYAARQHYGDGGKDNPSPAKGIPARPYLGTTRKANKQVMAAMEAYVKRVVDGR